MATVGVRYTGAIGADQPTLGLSWEPGEVKELTEEQAAAEGLGDPESSFEKATLKEARSQQVDTPATAPADAGQPAQTGGS